MHNFTDRILIGLGILLRPINEPSFLCSLTVVIRRCGAIVACVAAG